MNAASTQDGSGSPGRGSPGATPWDTLRPPHPPSVMNPRALAARILSGVLRDGHALDAVLEREAGDHPQRSLIQELSYGVLRRLTPLQTVVDGLLRKPFKAKDFELNALLLVGLYQLLETRVPDHAAVFETASGAKALGHKWAVAVANGVLRRFLRERPRWLAVMEQEPVALAHPDWLLEALGQAWPEQWRSIVSANNQRPPLWLRVNRRITDRATCQSRLAEQGLASSPSSWGQDGLRLAVPQAARDIPGFAEGAVSVQDAAPQLAASLLNPQSGERVLDACAAPGGKTGHLLERAGEGIRLTAMDRDSQRLRRVRENLQRLEGRADLRVGDAASPDQWWDGQLFDRILADVPCSATGVIRRHPDIKWLRGAEDIASLVETQRQVLEGLWSTLALGGTLLYATCSVLPAENEENIAWFLARHPEAEEVPIEAGWGLARLHGRQILPGMDDMDGFYYARLRRT